MFVEVKLTCEQSRANLLLALVYLLTFNKRISTRRNERWASQESVSDFLKMLLFPPVIASFKNILGFLLPLSYKEAWALEVASPFDVTTLGLFSFHPYAFQKLPITPFDFTLLSCIDTSKLLHPEKWGIPLCLLQVLGDLNLSSAVRAALEKIHDEWILMADSFQVRGALNLATT